MTTLPEPITDPSIKVIDNFLSEEEFKIIQDLVINNSTRDDSMQRFGYTIETSVSYNETSENYDPSLEDCLWNWFGCHHVYGNNQAQSVHYYTFAKMFYGRLGVKAPLRAKVNFYPNTPSVFEHGQHMDYPYHHNAAVFYVNTCDGFTRIGQNTKVDSVANRMLIFNGSNPHNSTTTSNQKGRYVINFNWF
jgi:hypothetical protein